jgi:transglutaminase-like putative cysteine protease
MKIEELKHIFARVQADVFTKDFPVDFYLIQDENLESCKRELRAGRATDSQLEQYTRERNLFVEPNPDFKAFAEPGKVLISAPDFSDPHYSIKRFVDHELGHRDDMQISDTADMWEEREDELRDALEKDRDAFLEVYGRIAAVNQDSPEDEKGYLLQLARKRGLVMVEVADKNFLQDSNASQEMYLEESNVSSNVRLAALRQALIKDCRLVAKRMSLFWDSVLSMLVCKSTQWLGKIEQCVFQVFQMMILQRRSNLLLL